MASHGRGLPSLRTHFSSAFSWEIQGLYLGTSTACASHADALQCRFTHPTSSQFDSPERGMPKCCVRHMEPCEAADIPGPCPTVAEAVLSISSADLISVMSVAEAKHEAIRPWAAFLRKHGLCYTKESLRSSDRPVVERSVQQLHGEGIPATSATGTASCVFPVDQTKPQTCAEPAQPHADKHGTDVTSTPAQGKLTTSAARSNSEQEVPHDTDKDPLVVNHLSTLKPTAALVVGQADAECIIPGRHLCVLSVVHSSTRKLQSCVLCSSDWLHVDIGVWHAWSSGRTGHLPRGWLCGWHSAYAVTCSDVWNQHACCC